MTSVNCPGVIALIGALTCMLAGCGSGGASGSGADVPATVASSTKAAAGVAATPPAGLPVRPIATAHAEPRVMPPPEQQPRGRAPGHRPTWPPVEFQPPEMNFGVLEPPGVGQGVTRIWNSGTQPLRIVKSITSCGCTAAEDLSGRTIEPGGYTDFTTTMEMKSGLGPKMEKITILFEGYERPDAQVVYFFKAEVSRAVQATPPHLAAFDQRSKQAVLSGEIALESRDGRPFRVLASHGRPPQFVDFDPASDTPRARYTLRWDITAEHNAGNVPWFWVFETDHPEAPLVDVRVQHDSTRPDRVTQPWVPKDQRLLLDELRQGESVEAQAKIEYAGTMRPEPQTARVSGDNAQFWTELVSAVPDGQLMKLTLRITPKPGAAGLLYGTVQVTASGRTAPLRIIGKVVG